MDAMRFKDSTPGIQFLEFDSASETWDKLHGHYDKTTTIVYLLPTLPGSVGALQPADQFADLAALEMPCCRNSRSRLPDALSLFPLAGEFMETGPKKRP